jgi:hypothetical protein
VHGARGSAERPSRTPSTFRRWADHHVAMEELRAELEQATAALREHLASWPYAFAMAGGCHGGAEHPALRAELAEVDRLRRRCGDLRARIAEHGG